MRGPRYLSKKYFNKKVLLRDRKRHTARRVASTRSAVLVGRRWGYPSPILNGKVSQSCPGWGGGYPILTWTGGMAVLSWLGGTPVLSLMDGAPVLGSPKPGLGYPQARTRVPPPAWNWGTPRQRSGTRDLGKNLGMGYPPPSPQCEQTDTYENIIFPILRMWAVKMFSDKARLVCRRTIEILQRTHIFKCCYLWLPNPLSTYFFNQ